MAVKAGVAKPLQALPADNITEVREGASCARPGVASASEAANTVNRMREVFIVIVLF